MADINFETEFEMLKKELAVIENEQIGIEEAINSYEKGIMHYKNCQKLLSEYKQKIEIIRE